jgi:hypothetical protein
VQGRDQSASHSSGSPNPPALRIPSAALTSRAVIAEAGIAETWVKPVVIPSALPCIAAT